MIACFLGCVSMSLSRCEDTKLSNLTDLSHAQRERLAYIDFCLQYFGQVSRKDLITRFKTGLAASTRDFSTYKALAPNNLVLHQASKLYLRNSEFSCLFNHNPEVILTSLSRGFGNGISLGITPSQTCMDAVRLTHPDAEIIAALMRAIHGRYAVKCGYVSLSSGETERELVPHAIANNGHRWHVRAYDRKQGSFRDFVCTRFTFVEALTAGIREVETNDYDQQWHNIVNLHLVPHPNIQFSKAIEMDYAMSDGQLVLAVRAALAAYLLRQWQVDCSEKANVKGCQLALKDLTILQQLENVALVPGYR